MLKSTWRGFHGVYFVFYGMMLVMPLAMLGMGRLFMKSAPKKINHFFGYRTARSMKNGDTWEFAHRHFGRNAYLTGRVVLALTALVMVLLWGQDSNTVGLIGGIFCLVQCVPLLVIIYPTEEALERTFDQEGRRR